MSDFIAILQTAAALLFVLSLILLCAAAIKRYAPRGFIPQGRTRRLRIVETLPLDPRHRAVLLRCDNQEHLLVIGDNGTTAVTNRPAMTLIDDTAESADTLKDAAA